MGRKGGMTHIQKAKGEKKEGKKERKKERKKGVEGVLSQERWHLLCGFALPKIKEAKQVPSSPVTRHPPTSLLFTCFFLHSI
ncbi:unnamed protein product [Camellia sinensis]